MTRPGLCDRDVMVDMIREDLEDMPNYPLPSPYSVRWYQPGDDKTWLQIESKAEPSITFTPQTFVNDFGSAPQRLAERQCFLCDGHGTAIGTATACFDDDYLGLPYGRVHWVAIVPEMQGRGLAKPLMSVTCNRLRDLGHVRGHLLTSTARVPAINLYLRFGFVPVILSAEDLCVWHDLEDGLREPLDLSQFSRMRSG
jgi:GNAT superfamily N-acetyltransferase